MKGTCVDCGRTVDSHDYTTKCYAGGAMRCLSPCAQEFDRFERREVSNAQAGFRESTGVYWGPFLLYSAERPLEAHKTARIYTSKGLHVRVERILERVLTR